MPETLDDVARHVDAIERTGNLPCALLVVPCRGWTDKDIDRVRAWTDRGFEIAGHGWLHDCTPRSLYHRLHSLVISRNVAEHLAHDNKSLCELVARCHAWFGEHGLPVPTMYVPPAWAMGALTKSDMRELPFRYFESLTGVYDAESGVFQKLPVVGFEADTLLRQCALRMTNGIAQTSARLSGTPLRISIHPFDDTYRIAADLDRMLCAGYRARAIDDLAAQGDAAMDRGANALEP